MNTTSRSVKALLCFLNNLLSQLADAFISLFITPLIVITLGTEVFGAWKIITNTTDFLTLGNFKPLGLLRLTLAKEISNENVLYKQQQIGTAISVLILTLPLLLLLSFLLFYYKDTLIPVSKEISQQVDFALLASMFIVVITPFLSVPDTVVKGLNLEYKLLGVSSFSKVITAILTYYVVARGVQLQWVVIVSSLKIFIAAAISYIIVKRYVPWFKALRPPKGMLSSFFKMNIWALLANLFRYIFLSADLILVGYYFGATTTAIYSLSKSLVTFLFMPANSLMGSSLAGVGDLVGRKDFTSVLQLRSEQINTLIFTGSIIGIIVMLFNASFVNIWVDAKHFGGETLSRWIIVATIIDALAKTEASYIDASLQLKAQAIALGSAAVIYLIVIMLGEPFLGLIVFPVSQAISQAVLMILYWIGIRDCLHDKLSNIVRVVLRPFSIAAILFYGCLFIPPVQVNNWTDLITHGAVVGSIAFISSWLLILNKNDRKKLLVRLSKMIGK